jgi:hypothetical protein
MFQRDAVRKLKLVNCGKSAHSILHLFKNRGDARADFKNQRDFGVP